MIIGVRLLSERWGILSSSELDLYLYLAGAAVILGHNFPIYSKFKGGKGTASIIGVLFALHWPVGLAGLLLLICMTLLTDYLLIGVLFFYFIFIGASIWTADGLGPILIAAFLFVMAAFLHLENVQRLLRNEETKISSVIKKKKPSL